MRKPAQIEHFSNPKTLAFLPVLPRTLARLGAHWPFRVNQRVNQRSRPISEQHACHLPQDHAFHSGPTYFCNDFNEWHYFTFLGTDKKTGHKVTLFSTVAWQGWCEDLKRPSILELFAWHDTNTGEFIGSTLAPCGKFESKGSYGNQFGFNYSVMDEDGKGFATIYDYAQERWNFKSFAAAKSQMISGKPYSMDVTGFVS